MNLIKSILAVLAAMAFAPALHAQVDAQEDAFCKQLIALVRKIPTDFTDHRGAVEIDNQTVTLYSATPPCPDLHAAAQYVRIPKNGEAACYRADYTGDKAIAEVETAFLGLAEIFSHQGNNQYGGFSADITMQKHPSGVMAASVFYHGITVALLNIPEKRDEATLFIGLVQSEKLAADKAILVSIPAQPVVIPKESAKSRVNILPAELAKRNAAETTPPAPAVVAQVDSQEEAFCQQLIALVRLAQTDYRDQRGPVAGAYEHNTVYTVTTPNPALQTAQQWIYVPTNGTAVEFRAVYTGEAAIAHVQSAMLGLSAIFTHPGNKQYEGFSGSTEMLKGPNGILNAAVHYKGITVALLNIAAKGDEATLYIGISFSKNLAADQAMLASIPAQPVVIPKESVKSRVNILPAELAKRNATGTTPQAPAVVPQVDKQEESFCRQVIDLVRLAPTDFCDNRGTVLREDEAVKIYNAAAPYPDLHAANQGINVSKTGKAPFYRATYMGAEEVSYAQTAFLGLAARFSLPGKNNYEGFTADAVMRKDEDGDGYALLFYNGLIVAKLEVPAKRESATILIGLLYSKDLAADKAKLPPVPAQPTGASTEYAKGQENILPATLAGKAPTVTAPPDPAVVTQIDKQEEAFCRQLVALVRLAPTDYRDHRGAVAGDYSNATSYTVTPPYPDLQTAAQSVVVRKNGTRSEYRAIYTGEAAIAYAQTACLGLSAIFSNRGNTPYEGFAADTIMQRQADGSMAVTVAYKGITVAVLNIPAKREQATLYIGLLFSANMAADLADLSPPPAPPDPTAKSWGSPLADALMRLHSIANSGFKGVIGEQEKQTDGVVSYTVPQMLGADKVDLYKSDKDALRLRLTYSKTNGGRKQAVKDVRAFFDKLIQDGRYQRGYTTDTISNIQESGRDIFSLWQNTEKQYSEYLTIEIDQTPPILADEASYGGKNPSELQPGDTPQIWEIKGEGPTKDSYLRCNGIFKDGALIKGTKTFHGYGDFLDGIWYSEEWVRKPGENQNDSHRYAVVFHPAYSTDIIWGEFLDSGNMTAFHHDARYNQKNEYYVRANAPKWLLTARQVYDFKTKEDQQAEREKYWVNYTTIPYAGESARAGAEETKVFAAFDFLMQEAGSDFSRLKLGDQPSYASSNNLHEAADFLGADQHFINTNPRYTPVYNAVWHDKNPRAAVLQRLAVAYIKKLQASGAATSVKLEPQHGFVWVNGACLTYNYHKENLGEPLLISIGKNELSAAGRSAQQAEHDASVERQKDFDDRQRVANARDAADRQRLDSTDQEQKRKLQQESNDYYNKLHPYDEGRMKDSNGNIIR